MKKRQEQRLHCLIELIEESTDKLNRQTAKLKSLLNELQNDKEPLERDERQYE